MSRLSHDSPRGGEGFTWPRTRTTWSWFRELSWTRSGLRTGACGARPGIVRLSSASGQIPGKAVLSLARNWRRRGELVSDRVLRFPDRTWDELEGLPQPLRNAAHTAIFHLLEEPVPALADPFPETDLAQFRPQRLTRPGMHLVLGHKPRAFSRFHYRLKCREGRTSPTSASSDRLRRPPCLP